MFENGGAQQIDPMRTVNSQMIFFFDSRWLVGPFLIDIRFRLDKFLVEKRVMQLHTVESRLGFFHLVGFVSISLVTARVEA